MSDELHDKIDALAEQVSALTSALGVQNGDLKARHGGVPDRLTATDVMRVGFVTTRLATGYAIDEVDAFLDRVVEEISRLTEERDTARKERDALR